jgi:hypothetical protein
MNVKALREFTRVGRILLSAAFEFDFSVGDFGKSGNTNQDVNVSGGNNIQIKSGGQECPPHPQTRYCLLSSRG